MMNFKPGDRVRRNKNQSSRPWEEAIRFKNLNYFDIFIVINQVDRLLFLEGIRNDSTALGGWESKNFELVSHGLKKMPDLSKMTRSERVAYIKSLT